MLWRKFSYDKKCFSRMVSAASSVLEWRSAGSRLEQLKEISFINGPEYPGVAAESGWRGFCRRARCRVVDYLNRGQHGFNEHLLELMRDMVVESEAVSHHADKLGDRRPVLAFLVPYDAGDAASSGGAARLYQLARKLVETYEIYMVVLAGPRQRPALSHVEPGIIRCRIPASKALVDRVDQLSAQVGEAHTMLALSDVTVDLPLVEFFLNQIKARLAAVVLVGPYLYPWFKKQGWAVPVIYEAPDVQREFMKVLVKEAVQADAAAAMVTELEAELCDDAAMIWTVSEKDRHTFMDHYRVPETKLVLVRSGVSVDRAILAPPGAYGGLRKWVGLTKPAVLFVGSHMRPNLEAAQFIIQQLAPRFPDLVFVIIGLNLEGYQSSAGSEKIPENVVLTGRLSEREKETAMALTTIALNPLSSGSGTSLKVPDYIAHGKPIITTPLGLRGYEEFEPWLHCVELESFPDVLSTMLKALAQDEYVLDGDCISARDHLKKELDWGVIATKLKPDLERLLQ